MGLYHQTGRLQFVPLWVEGSKSGYTNTPIVILGGASAVGSLSKRAIIGHHER